MYGFRTYFLQLRFSNCKKCEVLILNVVWNSAIFLIELQTVWYTSAWIIFTPHWPFHLGKHLCPCKPLRKMIIWTVQRISAPRNYVSTGFYGENHQGNDTPDVGSVRMVNYDAICSLHPYTSKNLAAHKNIIRKWPVWKDVIRYQRLIREPYDN